MKRNRKEDWWKTMRKLESRKNDLPGGPMEYRAYANRKLSGLIWVPVEEPQFIGWESTILIGDLSLRRPDAGRLIEVANLVGQSKPTFFTNLNTLRLIRKGKTYDQIMVLHREEVRRKQKDKDRWYDSTPEGLSNRRGIKFHISEFEKKVPEHLRPYFELREKWIAPTAWKPEGYVDQRYVLGGKFPIRDLKVKVNQVYSTHKGIPKSEEISEHEKISQKLAQELWWSKAYGRGDTWWKRRESRSRRKYLKAALNIAKQASKCVETKEWGLLHDDYAVEDVFDQLSGKKIKGKV